MMNMMIRTGVAVTVGSVVLGAALFYFAWEETTFDGNAAWLYLMGVTFLVLGVLSGGLTWVISQVFAIKARLFVGDELESGDSSVLRTLLRREES